MKENNLIKKWLPVWQSKNPDGRLFRNNTGCAWVGKIIINESRSNKNDILKLLIKAARFITFGIGLKNKKGHPEGGGDLIGWTEELLCQKMPNTETKEFLYEFCESKVIKGNEKFRCNTDCPFKIAIFTSIEFKTKNVKQTPMQKKFHDLVVKSGGIAEVVHEDE